MSETLRGSPRRGNLPAELSSFVGRSRERAELKRMLAGSRLVTITGVGGVGKTRTALRLAAEVQRAFGDGAWLVDLSLLTDADLVPEAVAQTLGVWDQTARPQVAILAEFLAPCRLLLVLDNCEHLIDSCAALIDTLLRAARGLQVLATSRQPFGVQGEQVYPLPPLPTPDPDRYIEGGSVDQEQDAALVLFADRAGAAAPNFVLTGTNRGAAARLCQQLDGIPLGIELAAVRTRAFPVQQIAELFEGRSTDRLRFLSSGGWGTGGRHESLRTAIDWSYGLCTTAEGLLWARVSVFAGSFDLTAAQEVCADEQLPAEDVLELIAGLVDKSILLCEEYPPGARYRLLDTIRGYGLDLLRNTDGLQRWRQRHRDFYLRLAGRFDEQWCGADQVDLCTRLNREHPNLRLALDYSLSDPSGYQAALELTARLGYFWMACGHPREGRHYLDRVLAHDPAPGPALTRALWVYAWIGIFQGDLDTADARISQGLPYAQAQGDVAAAGWFTYIASAVAALRGAPELALTLAEEAADLHRRDGGDPGTGLLLALSGQSVSLAFIGEFDRARAIAEEYQTLCDRYGEGWARSYADYIQSMIELGSGDNAAAARYARDALGFKRRLGDNGGCAMAMDLLATATASLGEGERAARLLGIVHRIWHTIGLPQLGSPDLTETHAKAERLARRQLGDQRYDEAFADGLSLDLAAGLAYALDELPARQPHSIPAQSTPWTPLTRRECEVAELVADGLTNQQIADRLVIGKRTANTHIEHILTKLEFTSRVQIAAWVAAQRRSERS